MPTWCVLNKPELLGYVRIGSWPQAIERAATHPEEAQYRNNNGYGALHWACLLNPPVEMVTALLIANSEATSMKGTGNDGGYTPLHFACVCSSEGVVRELLKANISTVSLRDNSGRTPLLYLCRDIGQDIKKLNINRLPSEVQNDIFEPCRRLKRIWKNACLLAKAAYHGSIEVPLLNNKKWCVLHACAGIEGCPRNMLKLAVKIHPYQLLTFDEDGNLPLHIAAMSSKATISMEDEVDIISFFIEAEPAAARVFNGKGDLPLHLAIKSGKKWEEGVEIILHAYSGAITLRDEESGLSPFMLAAVGNGASLDCIYHVLRACPELERFSNCKKYDENRIIRSSPLPGIIEASSSSVNVLEVRETEKMVTETSLCTSDVTKTSSSKSTGSFPKVNTDDNAKKRRTS
mmetsp:Transcript_31838/g.46908  ORF Transcript_31838/g.46908 Transcript_31838/m.46908 type:complete len:404 (-) Transcript_31838:145-1356(-)